MTERVIVCERVCVCEFVSLAVTDGDTEGVLLCERD